MIRLQREAFDAGAEIAALIEGRADIGAVVSFTGYVRSQSGGRAITSMTLEHYPGMTENKLAAIEAEARERWPLDASLIVHRHGRLAPGEPIVLVVCASSHRDAAFDAARFLIDWLKTRAPLWKLEEGGDGANWVAAREDDDAAAGRWDKD